ncbi:cupin domain-containing protein [Acinetobacter sp. PK01]|uniref:cupin domain-containing protein n=1 Tax=Acinetobacter sp. PK01 TaxID=2930198 RepID=UPI001FB826F1|nr:cupin domain-containing protein [Acinetobacter sp. PK01]UOG19056.1 cupin domain-containing protein [Acinetobacter sp. PK01]
MNSVNIFDSLPKDLSVEVSEEIIHALTIRIERIVSKGHSSPDKGWYDQDENEWVMVVEGKAILEFEGGSKRELSTGDYINIPAHVKHKIEK